MTSGNGPRLIDFGEIVIFCREPEDRDRGNAFGGELPGQVNGGECFVKGVKRAGEKPNLLAGDDRDRSRLFASWWSSGLPAFCTCRAEINC